MRVALRRVAVGAASPARRRTSRVVFDAAVVSGPRRPQHRLGGDERPHLRARRARPRTARSTLFVGAASGGVWKSDDGGTTFKPVFDKQPVQSIGAIALDPSEPEDGLGRHRRGLDAQLASRSATAIYKSDRRRRDLDAHGPARVRADREDPRAPERTATPSTPASPGKLWSDARERGLYKTTDGGKTWTLVLEGREPLDRLLGLISMDPKNPDVLFAGAVGLPAQGLDASARAATGPKAPSGSGLFRSTDGGATWTELSAPARQGPARQAVGTRRGGGRAVAIRSVVYAFIESQRAAPSYRSDDGGARPGRRATAARTWSGVRSTSRNLIVDPTQPGPRLQDRPEPDRQRRRRRAASRTVAGSAHGDWHDVWIDPENTEPRDRRATTAASGTPTTAAPLVEGREPADLAVLPRQRRHGRSVPASTAGLQDNSSWVGDSSHPGGITNARWENIYGGDGFWAFPDPTDPDYVYAESQGGYSPASTAARATPATSSRGPATRRSCASTGTRRST